MGRRGRCVYHTWAKQCSMLASSNLLRHHHLTSKQHNQRENDKSSGAEEGLVNAWALTGRS
jgi:hypothetical protein